MACLRPADVQAGSTQREGSALTCCPTTSCTPASSRMMAARPAACSSSLASSLGGYCSCGGQDKWGTGGARIRAERVLQLRGPGMGGGRQCQVTRTAPRKNTGVGDRTALPAHPVAPGTLAPGETCNQLSPCPGPAATHPQLVVELEVDELHQALVKLEEGQHHLRRWGVRQLSLASKAFPSLLFWPSAMPGFTHLAVCTAGTWSSTRPPQVTLPVTDSPVFPAPLVPTNHAPCSPHPWAAPAPAGGAPARSPTGPAPPPARKG